MKVNILNFIKTKFNIPLLKWRIFLIISIIAISFLGFKHLYADAYAVKPAKKNRKHSRARKKIYRADQKIVNIFWSQAEDFSDYYLNDIPDSSQLDIHEIQLYDKYKYIADTFFNKTFSFEKFNGAILVAKNGRIVYEKYTGFQDKEKQIPITANTPFHIASVSKTFTAMCILKLESHGKLNINDPVIKYIPELEHSDITIKDLLSHRSGLNTYDHFMDNYWKNKNEFANNYDVLINTASHKNVKIKPADKKFIYSNTNYALLALIVERITNQPFPQFMKSYMFDPLQMNMTRIFTLEHIDEFTPSYDEKFRLENYKYLDAIYGDKGVYTTPRDLLKWDVALYNPVIFERNILHKAFIPYNKELQSYNNYGLGWRLKYFPKQDKFITYHYGWWHGNRSMFIRDISAKTTIIILSNKFYPKMYEAVNLIARFDNDVTMENFELK